MTRHSVDATVQCLTLDSEWDCDQCLEVYAKNENAMFTCNNKRLPLKIPFSIQLFSFSRLGSFHEKSNIWYALQDTSSLVQTFVSIKSSHKLLNCFRPDPVKIKKQDKSGLFLYML